MREGAAISADYDVAQGEDAFRLCFVTQRRPELTALEPARFRVSSSSWVGSLRPLGSLVLYIHAVNCEHAETYTWPHCRVPMACPGLTASIKIELRHCSP
jgi:hypothetical protein